MGNSDYETNYGDEEEQEQKKALQDIMRKLKSGEYSKVLVDIREKLGLAPKISCAQMEALLIHAVEDYFRKNAMTRDIVLMSWGLLQGYDNHRTLQEPKDFQTALAERSEKFLRESSYISKKYKNGEYVSYEVAQATIVTKETKNGKFEGNVLQSIRGALQKAGEYGINHLADYLYETNMAEYIKTVKNQDYSKLDYIPSHELPALLNVREDRPAEESLLASTEQVVDDDLINPDDEIDGYESETDTDYKPTPMPPDSPEATEKSSKKQTFPDQTQAIKRLQRRQNIVIAVVIILVVEAAVDCLYSYLSTRIVENEAAPLIEDILVITPEIQLYPGKEALIQMDIVPDEANIDSVSCIPDDPDVATVAHRMVTAQPKWQEENHETQITVQGGVSPSSQVHVTVLPDPREQFTGADRPDGKNVEREGGQ